MINFRRASLESSFIVLVTKSCKPVDRATWQSIPNSFSAICCDEIAFLHEFAMYVAKPQIQVQKP